MRTYLDNVAFIVLRLQESSQSADAHVAFQEVLADAERLRGELRLVVAANAEARIEVEKLRSLDRFGAADLMKEIEVLKQNQCLICENPADHDARACLRKVVGLRKENERLSRQLAETAAVLRGELDY
jgi:hypothetical protein